ncbi:MAG: DUF4870 domain-containing protein [Chloroflexota bacterium]
MMRGRELVAQGSDRTLGILAHASIAFGLLGVGSLIGIAINAVIWLRAGRSEYVAVQARQAGLYQLSVLLINVAIAGAWVAILVFVFMGESEIGPGKLSFRQIAAGMWLALIPLWLIWYLVTIGYGLYAASRIARGKPFTYPLVGGSTRPR